jgi:hypothetical protein
VGHLGRTAPVQRPWGRGSGLGEYRGQPHRGQRTSCAWGPFLVILRKMSTDWTPELCGTGGQCRMDGQDPRWAGRRAEGEARRPRRAWSGVGTWCPVLQAPAPRGRTWRTQRRGQGRAPAGCDPCPCHFYQRPCTRSGPHLPSVSIPLCPVYSWCLIHGEGRPVARMTVWLVPSVAGEGTESHPGTPGVLCR